MIDLGEQVFFGEYTDENGARRMLKEAAKKRCHGIDESRIKLIIKKDRGYITGAWHVQVKEAEYIRMLEAQNAELVKKTEQLQSSMDQVQKALQDNGFQTFEELLQAYSQVKRERYAAVEE